MSFVLRVLVLAALLWSTAPSLLALAQEHGEAPAVRHVTVVRDKSRTISISSTIRTATIAASRIADITPISDHTLYIQGKEIGTTNISIFGPDMHLVEVVDLDVTPDVSSLQAKIRAIAGARSIHVSSSHGQIVLSGVAPDAVTADRAVSIARSMARTGPVAGAAAQASAENDIINAMVVAPSQQVMLKVRFLEASRDAERDLGVNWFASNPSGSRGFSTGIGRPSIGPASDAGNSGISTSSTSSTATTSAAPNTGGISVIQSAGAILSSATGTPFGVVLANLVNKGANIDVMVSALETKGLVRRLAEPDLVALSGDTARFLAGGEFPVPIVTSTTGGGASPAIQFKNFGVSLAFNPTVLRDGIINLKISPEVSELDPSSSVTIQGTTVPGLVTRNAQTTVELRDGQSFAIAGLLQTRDTRALEQLPWIGNVPVLGTLFRSAAFQKHESDLVIIVTPHLVEPSTPAQHLATPFDQRLPSNDVDFFVNGQMEVPKRYKDFVSAGGGVRGPYGHIINVETGATGAVTK